MSESCKFLLVEDEPFAQIIGRHVIENAGHFVHVADSVKQALVLLNQNSYDLIFIDLGLPDGTGVELVQDLRKKLNLTTPMVAVTAFDSLSKKTECMANGFNDFMEKPFVKDKFKEMFHKYVVFAECT